LAWVLGLLEEAEEEEGAGRRCGVEQRPLQPAKRSRQKSRRKR